MPKILTKPAPERRIFISYSRADGPDVRELHKRLRLICMCLPGVSVTWIDHEQIQGGDEWRSKTLQAIADANVFIVGMSLEFADSEFCMQQELKRILTRCKDGRAKVIGVYLREVPNWDVFRVELDDGSVASLTEWQCLPNAERLVDGKRKLRLRALRDWPRETRDKGWNTLSRQLEEALIGAAAGPRTIVGTAAAGQLEVSPPSSAPACAPAGVQLSAQALPYLADRDDQCYELGNSLEPWMHSGCKRPLVVLSEGRSADCLLKWVERLRAQELVKGLGLETQGQSFGELKSFGWPTAALVQATADDARQNFRRAIGNCLDAKATSTFDELVAAYQTRQRATLMWTSCADRLDPAQALRALAGLLQLLSAWPDLAPASMLVVSINLERDAVAMAGGRARLGSVFEQALRLAQTQGQVHAAVLGSLPELDESAITRWAQDHAQGRLADDITMLCANTLPAADAATWPMRIFAEQARKWLAGA